MTRLRLLVMSIGVTVILSPMQVAQAAFPSLTGTVYKDVDLSGSMTLGEGIQGVTVQLFADDGDGGFDAAADEMVTTDITDLEGAYQFSGLGIGSFFVRQQEQTANGLNLPSSLSGLLTPNLFKIMIDDFSDQQVNVANPIGQIDSSNLVSSSVLGKQRDLHIEYISGSAETTFRSNPFGLNKVLEFDQAANVISVATVTWDGVDGDMSTIPAVGGLGGIDMTLAGNQAFAFHLGIDAAGAGETLVFRVYDGSEVSTATVHLPVTNGTASVFHVVPFDSFVGGASFDSVDAIQLQLGGVMPSVDAQVGPIGLIGPAVHDIAVPIPEPSAILLGLFAGVWVVGTRRNRRRELLHPTECQRIP